MQCLDTTCNVIEDGPSLSRLEAMIEHSLSEVNVSPPTGSSPRCVRMNAVAVVVGGGGGGVVVAAVKKKGCSRSCYG